jgi:type III pantothenate kinase
MLLAIDVGNSHTVCGIFESAQLLYHWRLKTDRRKTSDELAISFHTMLAIKGLAFQDISAVVIASVVPTQQKAWVNFTAKTGWPVLQVNSKTMHTGMKILTDNPQEVGADRIVNAVAAYNRFHASLIVVDFGTAITFDCVSADGDYIGGVIAPGIAISLDALSARTAKLPRVDISTPPPTIIGTNTVNAIKSGILYGYGGMVTGIIEQLQKPYAPDEPKVIATGGMAELIIPYTDAIELSEPNLTLEGLRILYEKNH